MWVRYLVLLLMSATATSSTALAIIYWLTWRAAPRGYGLLPLHVALVGTGTALVTVAGGILLLERTRLDQPLHPATVIFGVGCVLINASLVIIFGHIRRRRGATK